MTVSPSIQNSDKPSFSELFTPKLYTILKEGYSLDHLRVDAMAGLTVAIVAIPLSMAIAIASGATPAQGLYTAIIGGFFVSLLGGSRFQIGGPAGAFIVLVSATVQAHGMDGLILATLLAGLMLIASGYLQLGTYIKFIPYPVTVGFTAGIAVIIFASQLKELLGLRPEQDEPGQFAEKLPFLWNAMSSASSVTILLSLATIAGIFLMKRARPNLPVMLVAVAGATLGVLIFGLQVDTIGTRFGGIPNTLPAPSLPLLSLSKVIEVLPNAVAFALLGSIESLLSAVVADGMTGRRHRSNCELVAQGCANIASSLFGGICVTGTIARTATNIRAGAHSPMAGIFHSLFLLLFVLIAAPLASYIPLAALAAVLAVVAWDMVEKNAFAILIRASKGDAAVLLATFFLTIFRDLTEAIIIGFALGSALFIYRMSKATMVELHIPLVAEDQADVPSDGRVPYDTTRASDPDIAIYRISGAFFFGAAASIGSVLDRIADHHRMLAIDFSAVPFVDSTAVSTIEGLVRKASRAGVQVFLTGASEETRNALEGFGISAPHCQFADTIELAVSQWRQKEKIH